MENFKDFFEDNKKVIYVSASILFFALVFAFTGGIFGFFGNLPSISTLEEYTPSLITKIYDYKGELITELFTERRTLTPIGEIPANLKNAFIAIEDVGFYKHWGISPKGILRASLNNLLRRRVAQGGSTITQQLSKTIFLSPERTMVRKIKELIITLELEHNYSKDEILQLYVNQIYLGSGAYGVEAASKIYFSKHVQDLTLGECSLLAGLPRAPNYYSPFTNVDRARNRRSTVLRKMRELKYITKEEEAAADAEPINTEKSSIPTAVAPHFIEYVRQQLEPIYGNNMIYHGGLSIYTTLDVNAQRAAERSMEDALSNFDKERSPYLIALSTPSVMDGTSTMKVQGALVAIDPKTGGIRALVGGRDFRKSQFNRAIQAKRQPGSSFKTFVYTAAIDNGFSPVSVLDDSPRIYTYDGINWNLASNTTDYLTTVPKEDREDPMKVWFPQNYANKYYGKVLLRTAIEHSLNVCAVQVLEKIKPAKAVEYARRMGIKSRLMPTLSMALGASEVPVIEMVSAFGVLASGGIRTEPYAIVRVEDKDGRILEENMPQETEALSPQLCFVMTNLLKGVVQRGTGVAASWLGRPCAGKTGTTNDFSDAWFIGYTPQLVAGVWVGYDNMKPLGDKITGGRIACPIWASFMSGALKDEPVLNFSPPDGVVFALIDSKTGLLALSSSPNAYLEAFLKGTEPKEYYATEKKAKEAVINTIGKDQEGF